MESLFANKHLVKVIQYINFPIISDLVSTSSWGIYLVLWLLNAPLHLFPENSCLLQLETSLMRAARLEQNSEAAAVKPK